MKPGSADFVHNEAVALVFDPEFGAVAVGEHGNELSWGPAAAIDQVQRIEDAIGPRWVWWTSDTSRSLVDAGVHLARCWDLDAVHRLVNGGWRAGPARTWGAAHGLATDQLPAVAPVDLFTVAADSDPNDPVRSDGHLDPAWIDGGWRRDVDRLAAWARLALEVHRLQGGQIAQLDDRPAALATARSESAASLLAVELGHNGLPIDVDEAERIIASFIGPRPRDAADERQLAAERDDLVLAHLPADLRRGVDLRNPANVKSLLRRAGIEVDDTRGMAARTTA